MEGENFVEILKKYWNYGAFRPMQREIIESVASGKDTLGLLPTGGGKSITFQVPTLAKPGICIVVTPLIALMKDQVENLRRRGIRAAMIYSSQSRTAILETFDNCLYGDFKFLYVSPERLGTELFQKRVKFLPVNMIAVDEAHCISQWGYDFRPSYLKIAEIRAIFPEVPILALTATATAEVVKDIQEKLKFPCENVFKNSFERKNLVYVVRETEDKLGQMLRILQKIPGTSVVYVRNRKKTAEISDFLNQNGITADFFHAGLKDEEKNRKQQAWKSGLTRVIVATNAFGMGIDKPDVRTVIHIDLPDAVEAYFQEAGRAGRDGQKAFAVLLYNNTDATKIKKRIADSFPTEEFVKKVYDSLAYYFQIAEGSGEDKAFAFNLNDFCGNFHLPLNPTFNALKILECADYLTLTEELDNPSKLKITVSKEDLYRLKEPSAEPFLKVLLRSYTGVFADYVHIDEDLLAKRIGCTRDDVYKTFLYLTRCGIMSYIPFKKTPFVIYRRARRVSEEVFLPPSAYSERKARFEAQVGAMLEYAQGKKVCRSQFLLSYFSQKNAPRCGQCDVCLAENRANVKSENIDDLKAKIRATLTEPMLVHELVKKIDYNEPKLLAAIDLFFQEGFLRQRADLKVEVNE